MNRDWVRAHAGGIRLIVHAQPRASRTEIAGLHGGALKIRLAAPPADGAANRELVTLLADRLGCAKSAVEIERGAGSRTKHIAVRGVAVETAREALLPGRDVPISDPRPGRS